MYDDIYIGNTKKTSKKTMYGHLSYVHNLPQKRQKANAFSDHYGQRFKYIMSHTDLHKCILTKVVKQLKPIGSTKPLKNQI